MRFEFDVIDQGVSARKTAIEFAQIEIQVLQFCAESAYYSRLQTCARCPTRFGFAGAAEVGNLCADVAERCADKAAA